MSKVGPNSLPQSRTQFVATELGAPHSNERMDSDVRTANKGLTAVDIRKSFTGPRGERIEVLRGVTLSVAPGESVAITGASGSGKSTLLQLLGGLDEADHGSVRLAETELQRLRGHQLAVFRRQHIGFVFQFHYLLPDLSAAENVVLPLLIARQKNKTAFATAQGLLQKLGLGGRLDHPVSHLSGGEQQRVAVARAFAAGPELLIADEPTGNLDGAIGEEISKTLINYARSQAAIVILATHNEKLARLCDRTLELKDGRVSSTV
jgi:predicted ABC-type transport system involved in lysophospholipase L1 biosynthesis ATPase subunit